MSELKQYNPLSKLLHWVTALLIFGLLFIGFYMVGLDFNEDKLALYALHKSFGLLVLALVIVRVIWHVICRKPKSLSTHTKIEKALAHSAHAFLYIALFAMPLSGWVMSSAGDFSIQFFGINLPDIVGKDKALFENSQDVHEIIAMILVIVVGLHILGALKHHFVDRDETLQRMISTRLGLVGGAIFTLVVGVLFAPAVYFVAEEVFEEISGKHGEELYDNVHVDVSDLDETRTVRSLWDIVDERSDVVFTATQYGQDFEGVFEIFDGKINFHPEDLESSSVHIVIDVASINTGSDERDVQAVSADWFNVDTYPKAEFSAHKFSKDANGEYVAYGNLSLRGVLLPVEFPFFLDIEGDRATMQGHVTLSRLDFGIGQREWQSTDTIGGRVDVKIKIEAVRN